ncbi:MAG: phosphoenolpyruvate--protein phosphotransferase [Endozoicomonas sp.]
MFSGIIASSGVAIGVSYVLKESDITLSTGMLDASEVDAELYRFWQAREKTVVQLEMIRERTAARMGAEEAAVFEGHILVATDEELESEVVRAISELRPADQALSDVICENIMALEELDDPYLRERGVDIKDVGSRMLRNLLGLEVTSLSGFSEGTILIADDLTPSETSLIDVARVRGVITNLGGRTSHSAIMARSLELPAIVGSQVATERIKNGVRLVLDAINNKVLVDPDEETLQYYEKLQKQLLEERQSLSRLKDLPCQTFDGREYGVCANIGTAKDVEGALRHGAEGIGLYRTEFLFMDRIQMPCEEEQFEAYRCVAQAVNRRTVIIRTLDIGGDKDLSYLELPREKNPFLGWRAIRMCFDNPWILKNQLRAILRASAYGRVKIMFPMVVSVDEVRRLKSMVKAEQEALAISGISFDQGIEIGVMVETPSAVLIADLLIEEVDFFSIGSNDLTQYLLAVDRGNNRISGLYDYFSPSVLRAVKRVVDCAHNVGKWVGMCGEMAGDELAVLLLAGFGMNEFSMSATYIPRVKKVLRKNRFTDLKALAGLAVNLATAREVRELLEDYGKRQLTVS